MWSWYGVHWVAVWITVHLHGLDRFYISWEKYRVEMTRVSNDISKILLSRSDSPTERSKPWTRQPVLDLWDDLHVEAGRSALFSRRKQHLRLLRQTLLLQAEDGASASLGAGPAVQRGVGGPASGGGPALSPAHTSGLTAAGRAGREALICIVQDGGLLLHTQPVCVYHRETIQDWMNSRDGWNEIVSLSESPLSPYVTRVSWKPVNIGNE